MAYIGNSIETQSFTGGMDQFNGNGSNTVFGLTRTINTAYDVDVYVENVWQRPTVGYNVSANTITFTSAPSSGSNNISVVYRSFISQSLVPSDGTVTTNKLGTITNINAGTNAALALQSNNATVVTLAANGNVGVGNTVPAHSVSIRGTLAASGNVDIQNSSFFVNSGTNKVGVGFSTPSAKLHVMGPLALSQTDGLMYFGNTSGTTADTSQLGMHWMGRIDTSGYHMTTDAGGWSGIAGTLGIAGKGGITFGTSNTSQTYATGRMIINTVGDVGIGNSSPVSKLHVTAAGANGIVLGTDANDSTASTRIFGQTASSNGGIFWYQNSGNPMWCFTTGSTVGSSTGTTRLTISQYGLALANYDAATSGTGIKFPATQNASSDANTLDDYEEGTWTPVLYTQNSSAYSFTTLTSYGTYTKVGNLVTLNFWVTFNGTRGGAGGDNVGISSLPFPCKSGSVQQYPAGLMTMDPSALADNASARAGMRLTLFQGQSLALFTTPGVPTASNAYYNGNFCQFMVSVSNGWVSGSITYNTTT